MKYVSALRRLLANTDRVNDLLAATSSLNERLAGLQQVIDKQSASIDVRLDSLWQGIANLAGDLNGRLDRVIETETNQSTSTNERLDAITTAITNQSSDANQRLEELITAITNQSSGANERLQELVTAVTNQSAGANERLEAVITAITNQSTAANLRLDRVVAAVRGDEIEDLPLDKQSVPDFATDRRIDAALQSTLASAAPSAAKTAVNGRRAARNRIGAAWIDAASPAPVPLPRWSPPDMFAGGTSPGRITPGTNALPPYQPLLDALEPWHGMVPKGFLVDFLGILTDAHFRTMFGADPATTGGCPIRTEIPTMRGENAEWWFENINWLIAAREARERFVMMTLGACYGAQAVGAFRALQIVNPLPCKLVAVEPVPENQLWLRKHFRDNGIDPDQHWLVRAAISDTNDPVYFPIGGAGYGANNCISTDTPSERKILVDQLIEYGKAADTLRSLMLYNTTGVIRGLKPGEDVGAEIEVVSAVTLRDLLSAFDFVDYVEADIQESEVRVFPPFLDLLRKKVRRIHIGTHGAENHDILHYLFAKNGWEIVFSYAPNGTYECELGTFELNDGVLTVRNPDL